MKHVKLPKITFSNLVVINIVHINIGVNFFIYNSYRIARV